jgi:hypothetical protein
MMGFVKRVQEYCRFAIIHIAMTEPINRTHRFISCPVGPPLLADLYSDINPEQRRIDKREKLAW